MNTETQNSQIIKHLENGGTLTRLEALNKFKCLNLPSRIGELRDKGYDIKTTMIKVPSFKRVARYSLEKEPELTVV